MWKLTWILDGISGSSYFFQINIAEEMADYVESLGAVCICFRSISVYQGCREMVVKS